MDKRQSVTETGKYRSNAQPIRLSCLFLFRFRAVDSAFRFQRGSDDYGKLFSIIPEFGKLFPKWSGYKECRDSAVALYDVFKVLFQIAIFLLSLLPH